MSLTEDIPYNAPGFATPEDEQPPDDDQPNKSVLLDAVKYLDEQIKKHNSLDVIKPEAEPIMTTQQQIVVHQEVTAHLRNIRIIINDKVKELR